MPFPLLANSVDGFFWLPFCKPHFRTISRIISRNYDIFGDFTVVNKNDRWDLINLNWKRVLNKNLNTFIVLCQDGINTHPDSEFTPSFIFYYIKRVISECIQHSTIKSCASPTICWMTK